MRTQQDSVTRILALDNLRAMCAEASGTAHQYWIDKVSRSRVHVGYSNPDEYGNDAPMFAVLPCFPSPWEGDNETTDTVHNHNPRVVLEIMRIIGAQDDYAEQTFEAVWALYATRTPSEWRVVTCNVTGPASRAALVAQHRAYHKAYDNNETCVVCA